MVREIRVITLMMALFLLVTLQLIAQECEQLKDAASDQLLSYLADLKPDETNAQCITFAIGKLGDQRYEPAVPVIMKFLDFRRPVSVREKQGLYVHIQSTDEVYPAARYLEEMGDKAVHAVLDAIKANSTSPIARKNAVFVWMEIYKSEPPRGVSLLREELDKSDEARTKQNLKWALSEALTLCNPPDKAECDTAAKTRR